MSDNIQIVKQTDDEMCVHVCCGCLYRSSDSRSCNKKTRCEVIDYYIYKDCTIEVRKEKIEQLFDEKS